MLATAKDGIIASNYQKDSFNFNRFYAYVKLSLALTRAWKKNKYVFARSPKIPSDIPKHLIFGLHARSRRAEFQTNITVTTDGLYFLATPSAEVFLCDRKPNTLGFPLYICS